MDFVGKYSSHFLSIAGGRANRAMPTHLEVTRRFCLALFLRLKEVIGESAAEALVAMKRAWLVVDNLRTHRPIHSIYG